MTDTHNTHTKGWYKHESAEECTKLLAKVKVAASKHALAAKMKQLIKQTKTRDSTGDYVDADEALYGIVIDQIDNMGLIATLATDYDDQGRKALDYICGHFHVGDDDNKQEAADDKYFDMMVAGLKSTATPEEARTFFTTMSNLRASLKDTSYAISNARHSRNMIRVVNRMGKDHRMEVRLSGFTDENVKDCPAITGTLEGIVRKVHNTAPVAMSSLSKEKLFAMFTDAGISLDDDALRALAVRAPGGRNASKCDKCGRYHAGSCFAAMLAKGEDLSKNERWMKMYGHNRHEKKYTDQSTGMSTEWLGGGAKADWPTGWKKGKLQGYVGEAPVSEIAAEVASKKKALKER